jgi:hypothetical protein
MKNRIIGKIKHWAIMQVIYSQSRAGRMRMKNLISVWMVVLGVVFALMAADLYVDGNKLRGVSMVPAQQASALSPAR